MRLEPWTTDSDGFVGPIAEASTTPGGPDPHLHELEIEVARLRAQLDDVRAQARLLSVERDELREGVVRALDQLANEQK